MAFDWNALAGGVIGPALMAMHDPQTAAAQQGAFFEERRGGQLGGLVQQAMSSPNPGQFLAANAQAFYDHPEGGQVLMDLLKYYKEEQAKPPEMRTIHRGDQRVDQEFNAATGAFEDIPGAIGPAFAPPAQTNVNLTMEAEGEFMKGLGKYDSERFHERIQARDRASAALPQFDRIEAAIKSGRFQTGAFGDMRAFFSQVGELVGADPEKIGFTFGAPETADTIESASAQLASIFAQEMGKNTNMALQLVKDSFPALSRTPEGNMIIVSVARRAANRARQVADLQEKYLRQYGTMRPKDPGIPSIEQAIGMLDETDPVITDDLQARMEAGSKAAPKDRKMVAGPSHLGGGSLLPPEPPASMPTQSTLPPIEQREVGQVYTNSSGFQARWNGTGWDPVQ